MTYTDDDIFAFVLMPIHDAFEDIYRIGVKEAAEATGIRAERVDDQIFQEGILDRIYRQIEAADIIIADMSGQNANVFYEVGYAHALNKLCILITNNVDNIPFDLKHRRHIVYGDSIKRLREALSQELEWARREVSVIRNSRIQVILKKISGTLEKSKFAAVADVDITLDLLNTSATPSADLEAMYFYCGHDWKLYQEQKLCPSTDSDISPFPVRHFLNLPVRKLHTNTWAQVRFKTKKQIASVFSGDELKDSYHISGRSVVRLVTSEGHFDYEVMLDVTCDEIPF